jgi:hypothetical protein
MACHTLRRRAGPAAGPGRALGPAGRLRCDARVGVAPPNSCRNAGPPQVSASPSGGRSRAARPWWHHFSSPLARCARTTAASQSTKRTARADPDAALLAALKGPAAGPARRLRGGTIAKSAASDWNRQTGVPPAPTRLASRSASQHATRWGIGQGWLLSIFVHTINLCGLPSTQPRTSVIYVFAG